MTITRFIVLTFRDKTLRWIQASSTVGCSAKERRTSYEFDDHELQGIAAKSSGPKFEKSILAFHGSGCIETLRV